MKLQCCPRQSIRACSERSAIQNAARSPGIALTALQQCITTTSATLSTAIISTAAAALLVCGAADARPQGVNRPELLPNEFTPVIDVAGFLTPSEERRIKSEVEALEQDTGFKLRVLAQNYPETPGLAVREYWKVDENTIVFVADPTFGDILNFNVGQSVDLEVPRSFWSRLAGKFGNKFFLKQNGEASSILNAVTAIDNCLREAPGKLKCSAVQGDDTL